MKLLNHVQPHFKIVCSLFPCLVVIFQGLEKRTCNTRSKEINVGWSPLEKALFYQSCEASVPVNFCPNRGVPCTGLIWWLYIFLTWLTCMISVSWRFTSSYCNVVRWMMSSCFLGTVFGRNILQRLWKMGRLACTLTSETSRYGSRARDIYPSVMRMSKSWKRIL